MIKKFIFCSCLILLSACRSDLLVENSEHTNTSQNISNEQKRFSTSFVSEDGLEQSISDKKIKSILKSSINKILLKQEGKNQNENYSIYEKVYDSLNQTTTYSLSLIEYSDKNPFYLKNIITVKEGKEKFGFLKIIPNSKPINNKKILDNFSGVIQILDSEMNIRSETKFINGEAQNINESSSKSNSGKGVYCRETFDVVEHHVREQGMFSPITANPETANSNSTYYELVSTGMECYGTSGEEDLYISAPSQPTVNGGGGPTSINKVLNDPKFNYSDFLIGANKMDLLNFVARYVYVNDPASTGYYNEVDDAVITQLNQILSIFASSNNNLFSDFDNLQNLLSNLRFYLQGEGTHYDIRIYNLIKYLFDNPSQENANFVSWGTQFYIDNTSQNGICSVSSTEFENWFLNPSLSANLIDELRNDWENPNIVKPTAKFKSNVKLNSIYNQAKTAANFQQYLKNFIPDASVAHLMFDIGNVKNPDALAQTEQPANYWIKITFNQNWNYATTPKLIIANSFMHEMIHAEMFRKLLTLAPNNGNFDLNLVLQYLNNNNYSGMFDYYVRFSTSNTDVDHQIMAAHYINISVNFLKQIYGNKYSDIEYQSVVWLGGGLTSTRAWNLLPQSQKTLLQNTYQNNYNLWEL